MIDVNFHNQTDEDLAQFESLIEQVIVATVQHEGTDHGRSCEIVFVNNEAIQAMNQMYREKDMPTDVLSFPSGEEVGTLGDIIISVDKMREQAAEFGHGETREMAFLAVHGFLHLLGYDHETEADETEMFGLQEAILNGQKIGR